MHIFTVPMALISSRTHIIINTHTLQIHCVLFYKECRIWKILPMTINDKWIFKKWLLNNNSQLLHKRIERHTRVNREPLYTAVTIQTVHIFTTFVLIVLRSSSKANMGSLESMSICRALVTNNSGVKSDSTKYIMMKWQSHWVLFLVAFQMWNNHFKLFTLIESYLCWHYLLHTNAMTMHVD